MENIIYQGTFTKMDVSMNFWWLILGLMMTITFATQNVEVTLPCGVQVIGETDTVNSSLSVFKGMNEFTHCSIFPIFEFE